MSEARALGKNARLYYNSASPGSPTWVAIGNVRDVKIDFDKKDADAATRDTGGVEAYLGTFIACPIDFQMNHNTADAGWQALKASFFNFSAIELLVLDGPKETTGSQGWRCPYECMKFAKGEPLM